MTQNIPRVPEIPVFIISALSPPKAPPPNSQHPMMPLLPRTSNFLYLMKSSCHKGTISCKILNHKSVGLKGRAHLSHPVAQELRFFSP